MDWNSEESKLLKSLRLSPVGNSRQKLVALVHHFKGPNPSVFAITEGKAEPKVGKDLAKKVRDLTQSGQLDWLVNAGGEGTNLGLDVAAPKVGWWNLRAGPTSARFITIEIGAVSVMQRMCHASLFVESSSGLTFPLHWGGEPTGINETQPEFLTIHPDVPGRRGICSR